MWTRGSGSPKKLKKKKIMRPSKILYGLGGAAPPRSFFKKFMKPSKILFGPGGATVIGNKGLLGVPGVNTYMGCVNGGLGILRRYLATVGAHKAFVRFEPCSCKT
jgi:hypothetical protein